jgi:hypothetical protein
LIQEIEGTYIPFFLAEFFCHDWQVSTQQCSLVTMALINTGALVLFAGILGWI